MPVTLREPRCARAPRDHGERSCLLRSPQQVLSREQILTASRLHDEEVFDRSIDVQILRPRRKLAAYPSQPKLIKTERGTGHVLATWSGFSYGTGMQASLQGPAAGQRGANALATW